MSGRLLCWGGLIGCFAALLAGCGSSGPTGDLAALTDDTNENGFLDVTPPDGVEFLTVENVKVRLMNTVSAGDLGTLAAQYGVDPALLSLVTIVADIGIDLDYGGGISDTLTQSEQIEPFDRRFEIACPENVAVAVNVVANVPVVGPQQVTDFNVDLSSGVEYACGQTIQVEVFVNDSGNPDVAVTVE